MTILDPKYANLSTMQVKHMIEMTTDVLTDSPDLAWAKGHLEALNAVLRVRGERSAQPDTFETDSATVGRPAGSKAGNQYGTFAVHSASPAQVRFLQTLINTKVTDDVTLPATLDNISKTAASALIDKLIDRPIKAGVPVKLASEKQINFLRKLIDEKAWELAGGEDYAPIVNVQTGEPVSAKSAGEAITWLLTLARKPVETTTTVDLESGIYLHDGQVFKVYTNQARTRMLAKLLVLPEGWVDLSRNEREASDSQPQWIYQGVASRFVKADEKMTLEQAKEFGAIYGVCSNCGRLLTNEDSIEAGLGPICRNKFL